MGSTVHRRNPRPLRNPGKVGPIPAAPTPKKRDIRSEGFLFEAVRVDCLRAERALARTGFGARAVAAASNTFRYAGAVSAETMARLNAQPFGYDERCSACVRDIHHSAAHHEFEITHDSIVPKRHDRRKAFMQETQHSEQGNL